MTWAKNMIISCYWVISPMNQKKKACQISETLTFWKLLKQVKQRTCFKSLDRLSCMDLILTNSSRSFQDTCTVETGLPDFHKLVVTVLKLYFPKQKPNIQTSKDSKMIYLDWNLIMSYQNLMHVTENFSIF